MNSRNCSSPSVLIDKGKMIRTEPISSLSCNNIASPPSPFSSTLHKVSSINRSFASMDPGSRSESLLELEAVAAAHELSFAVQSIGVSEMLPRTCDLIFVNLTTLEEQPYCVELTHKGWRITSLRYDCMMGDFTRLQLFTKYYDSLHLLMFALSPGYRSCYNEKVSQRFTMLELGDESDIASFGSSVSPKIQSDSLDGIPISKQVTFYSSEP